jgi:NADPH oxidase
LPGFLAIFFERFIREYRARQKTTLTKVIFHPGMLSFLLLPGNTLEIQFDKPSMDYKPGMYLFLNVPELSRFQWHPFTITSTPEEPFISVHIRLMGDWTNQLAELVGAFKGGITSKNASRLPTLRVDGPFGAPAEDLYDYKTAVLVGAGIGVTPAAALLKSIWYRHYRKVLFDLLI